MLLLSSSCFIAQVYDERRNESSLSLCMLQLIDMTPGELQWLSSHLGHDVTTHKGKYRLHAPAIEITKVGRLLLAVDGGKVPSSRRVASGDGNGDDDDGDLEMDVPSKSAAGRRRRRRRVASVDGDGEDDDGDLEMDVPSKSAAGCRRRVASADGDGEDRDMEAARRRLPGLFS